jgi:hypothetical protein
MEDWAEGDRVGVTAGPFSGFSGTIERVESKNELVVSVEIFGHTTSVFLRVDQLGPDNGGPSWSPDFPDDDGGDGGARQPRKPVVPTGGDGFAPTEIEVDLGPL